MYTKFQISTLRNEPNTGVQKKCNAMAADNPLDSAGGASRPLRSLKRGSKNSQNYYQSNEK